MLLHVQLLQMFDQLPVLRQVVLELVPPVVLVPVVAAELEVHAVEADNEAGAFDLGLDRVEGGDEVEDVLFEGEEEDVGVQPEFKHPRNDYVAVVTSDAVAGIGLELFTD